MTVAGADSVAEAIMLVAAKPLETSGSAWIAESGRTPWAVEFPTVPGSHNKLNVPASRALPRDAPTES